MQKLLIVDAAEDFCNALADALKGEYIVRTCNDGEKAFELLNSFCPELLVLDLTVAGIDGLSIVQMISGERRKPGILATTRFLSDYMLETASRIGIDYMVVKPCNIKALTARLADLAANRKEREIVHQDNKVTAANLLLSLGLSTNCKGYNYLREAIPAYAKDPGQAMTKELYPSVGKKFGASALQVERAMRTAIEKAWKRRDDVVWGRFFVSLSDGTIEKPCNSEFISRLADVLILQKEE